MGLFYVVKRKLDKFRLKPIHIFLFHHVSDVFDESTMKKNDWTEIRQFKRNIEKLNKKYTFISLTDAYERMKNDIIRFRNYAVLTSDDGWASLMNILPWLQEQNIPVTLFLNPCYLDGKSYRERNTELYLTEKDVDYLDNNFPLVSFGSHGWDHNNIATTLDHNVFAHQVSQSVESLSRYHHYIPFFAYIYGNHNEKSDSVLREMGLVPVLIDNYYNLNDTSVLHRELLDGAVM